MMNLYTLPDTVKLVVRPELFIPQTSIMYLKNTVSNSLNVSVKESEKGVSFILNSSAFFFKAVDNSLWIKFNLIKKTIDQLERMGVYKKSRGYGESYNFIDPDFLDIEMKSAVNEVYKTFLREIAFSIQIFSSIIYSGFEMDLLPAQSVCKLYWIDMANDFLSSKAPDEIDYLRFGFKVNNELCYSYEDDQLKGICAHVRKKDGTHGQKMYRMYLKNESIVRYESC